MVYLSLKFGHYRVLCSCIVSNNLCSDQCTIFHTHTYTAPSGPPDNITATALSSTSMLVSWSPPLQQFRNGPILAYNFTVMEASTDTVVQSSILLTTYATVFSLRPFTDYNFTVSARTSVGYGPSDTITEITLQDSKQDSISGGGGDGGTGWEGPAGLWVAYWVARMVRGRGWVGGGGEGWVGGGGGGEGGSSWPLGGVLSGENGEGRG